METELDSSPPAVDRDEVVVDPRELTPLEFLARVYNRVLISLVLYVLSIGPMFWKWHYSAHFRSDPFFLQLYSPLLTLCENSPKFKELLNWYIELWIL